MSQEKETFAAVKWSVDDVQSLRPSWSKERCRVWLMENEDYISERLIDLGWEVLEALLPDSK